MINSLLKFLNRYLIILVGALFICSCKKFLDVGEPFDRVPSTSVYKSDLTATSVLAGIYFEMQDEYTGFTQGRNGLSFLCGLSSDELKVLPLSAFSSHYNNDEHYNLWGILYQLIYKINAAIEGVSLSENLSNPVKNQLLGECKFLRAFCYFHLINLYGDVPLVLTTDYRINSTIARTEKERVYAQMVNDLLDAQEVLTDYFVAANAQTQVDDRTRPNKWAAVALLARIYLYNEDWGKAEEMASLIINNKTLFDTIPLESVFIKNSKEAIWQLQSIDNSENARTLEATLYILENGEPDDFFHPAWISPLFFESLEDGDRRKQVWLNVDSSKNEKYYYPFKYKYNSLGKNSPEYLMVLRVAEQYLIRAEAWTRLGNISNAKRDLNVIRFRAGLPPADAFTEVQLMNEILQERRVELFTEWGHRWFDLKRMGKIDDVMSRVPKWRAGSWESYKKLWPIPITDINLNKNIIQNEGYPSL